MERAWQGSKWIRPEKRQAIYARDGHRCVYCGRHESELADDARALLTLDHVRAVVSDGRTNAPTNLVTCCLRCNSRKQGRTMRAWLAVLRADGIDTAVVRKRIARATRRAIDRAWGRVLAGVL